MIIVSLWSSLPTYVDNSSKFHSFSPPQCCWRKVEETQKKKRAVQAEDEEKEGKQFCQFSSPHFSSSFFAVYFSVQHFFLCLWKSCEFSWAWTNNLNGMKIEGKRHKKWQQNDDNICLLFFLIVFVALTKSAFLSPTATSTRIRWRRRTNENEKQHFTAS